MDPFAAIGLAGNICQFVDFGCKLFSTAHEISVSVSGTTEETDDAATIAASIEAMLAPLVLPVEPQRSHSREKPSKIDTQLVELASKCRNTALELIRALEAVQAKVPKSKWSSCRAALKLVWNERKIRRMQERLSDHRQHVVLILGLLQADQQSGFQTKFDSLKEANREEYADLTHRIAASEQQILQGIRQLKLDLSNQGLALPGERLEGWAPVADVAANIVEQARHGVQFGIALSLLRTLRFKTMRSRYAKVPRAHEKTLQWMFDNTFSRWLASDHPIFWISGKPGSGKSTSMKFLVDNEQTSRYLQRWAKGSPVATAHYFFWVNGTDLERSQEGLLRSLLYDIFRQEPLLLKHVFPQRWSELEQGIPEGELSPWIIEELVNAAARALDFRVVSKKFCIFIDGLDEYDGRHEDLVKVIKGLVSTNNVKICIASRPWNVFESAFGDDQMHKLYLEHLNRPDIQAYVKAALEDRQDFQKARVREPKIITIPQEIVSKSQGVFLWVFLVVRSLVEGLQNRDRLVDLLRRLRSFPSDLNDFFRYMLMSVDDPYHNHTARVFQIALAAPRPLPSLQYWYADLEEDDPDFWTKVPISSLSKKELEVYQEDVQLRLNSRTKGLLEVTPNEAPGDTVDFLHRTVKDYLQTTEVQRLLDEWCIKTQRKITASKGTSAGQSFDPHQTICKATLAAVKTGFSVVASLDTLRLILPLQIDTLLDDFFKSLNQYEDRTGQTLSEIVDLLAQTVAEAAESGARYYTQADITALAKKHGANIWVKEREVVKQTGSKKKKLLDFLFSR